MDLSADLDLQFDEDVLVFHSSLADEGRIGRRHQGSDFLREIDRFQSRNTQSSSKFNIYSACKAGDLQRVRHLVEVEDVDINRCDMFNSVPLFYACLCGHAHLVKYLLDRGAILDASTFVGARCYYAALDDGIRNLLKSYQAKPSQEDMHSEMLERIIFQNPYTPFSDFEFIVQEKPIRVHRFVVMSQCEFFRSRLQIEPWCSRRRMRFTDVLNVSYGAFFALIVYFYTDKLQLQIDSLDFHSFIYLIGKLKMHQLKNLVLHKVEEARSRHIRQLILRPRSSSSRIKSMMQLIFDDMKTVKSRSIAYPDIILKIAPEKYLPCHRVVLFSFSEYFRSLFSEGFAEYKQLTEQQSSETNDVACISLQAFEFSQSDEILECMVEFMYRGNIKKLEVLDLNILLEQEMSAFVDFIHQLLQCAEFFLVQNLIVFCFRLFPRCMCSKTVWTILALGIQRSAQRLLDAATDFVSMHHDKVYQSEEFCTIMENSQNVPLYSEMKQILALEIPSVWEYLQSRYFACKK